MTGDQHDAADAFGVVGNEHRVAILRSLMRAYRDDETPLPYSALMDRVDVQDSGRFNYHLQQLLGRFVVDGDDGYALTYAGRTVVSAIAAGTLDGDASLEPVPVDGACYACGDASLVLRYPGERVRVTCAACGEEVAHIQFPPAGVTDRAVTELQRDFDRWGRWKRSLLGDGVCPECSGRVDGELRYTGDPSTSPTVGDVDVRAVVACDRCWVRGSIPPGVLVLDHPAVVSFFWQHGVDVRERPVWQEQWALSGDALTVVSEDPLRVELEVTQGEETLEVVVDDSLSVASVTRRRDP